MLLLVLLLLLLPYAQYVSCMAFTSMLLFALTAH